MMRQSRNAFSLLFVMMILLVSITHAQNPASSPHAAQPQAGNATVTGSGTSGRLSKWSGVAGASTFTLGDSLIFENKNGLLGIGTDSPTSKLTVQGMIETTLGGYKFPDGTVQTTAAITANQVVSSLNGLKGDLTLAAGPNITITPNGKTLTISAPNALSAITHNATLAGDGTQGSPLGIALPLMLTGSSPANVLVQVWNNAEAGTGLISLGGDSPNASQGGIGLRGFGGTSNLNTGGIGMFGVGGFANNADGNPIIQGGTGVVGFGGNSYNAGGPGMDARGGNGSNGPGGTGIRADGGFAGGSSPGGDGLVATAGGGMPVGRAGVFNGAVMITGDLNVTGNVSKGGGSFKIDHPLDPENKYLYHSFVESPDMMNVYNGNTTTNESGEAVVALPDYFEALNQDFRYQLTVIGQFAQAIVASEIQANHFVIKTNAPNVKVSWQITGIRQDPYANKNRIQVEVNKSEQERGFYLHPDLYNQPEEKGLEWARNPHRMQELKQHRLEAEQKRKQIEAQPQHRQP